MEMWTDGPKKFWFFVFILVFVWEIIFWGKNIDLKIPICDSGRFSQKVPLKYIVRKWNQIYFKPHFKHFLKKSKLLRNFLKNVKVKVKFFF